MSVYADRQTTYNDIMNGDDEMKINEIDNEMIDILEEYLFVDIPVVHRLPAEMFDDMRGKVITIKGTLEKMDNGVFIMKATLEGLIDRIKDECD